jgi:hypothetical protein
MLEIYLTGAVISFLISQACRYFQKNTRDDEFRSYGIDEETIQFMKKERTLRQEIAVAAIWTFLWPVILLAIIYSIFTGKLIS